MQKHWYDFDLLMSLNVGQLSLVLHQRQVQTRDMTVEVLNTSYETNRKISTTLGTYHYISPNQILSTRRVHITTASMPMELWCQYSFVVVITAYFDKSMSSTAHAQKSFGQQSRSHQCSLVNLFGKCCCLNFLKWRDETIEILFLHLFWSWIHSFWFEENSLAQTF